MSWQPTDIIARKRDGHELSDDEIAAVVRGSVDGSMADYQLSAWLMAVFLRGMNSRETADLTRHMLRSGTVLRWPADRPTVDKHSTGGVGDKVSLVLAPLLACCGLRVPMISGRGLGATGGTLDKLEAMHGFRAHLTRDEMTSVCEQVGCVICGATADLVPADKKLYALRDVTATVASIPLITASIMSKKLAEGLDALVLDVKWGSGAFMRDLDGARRLARSLVDVGKLMGLRTTALVTDMNQPLGRMAGHGVELMETLELLRGGGPADVRELTLALGAELLVAVGIDVRPDAASARLAEHLDSGRALEKYRDMVRAQGADADAPLKIAPAHEIVARRNGYITAIDADALGRAITALGGGRAQVADAIDHRVGLRMRVRIGDRVAAGQELVSLFAYECGLLHARPLVEGAIVIGDEPVTPGKLIVERVT